MHSAIRRDDIEASVARPIDISIEDRHGHGLARGELYAGLLGRLREDDLVVGVVVGPVVAERVGAQPDESDVVHDRVDGLDLVGAGAASGVQVALEDEACKKKNG